MVYQKEKSELNKSSRSLGLNLGIAEMQSCRVNLKAGFRLHRILQQFQRNPNEFSPRSPQGPAGLKGGEGPQGPPGPVVSILLAEIWNTVG